MLSSRPLRFLSEPRRAAARALARWARARQGEDLAPVVLHSRRIYILPTRAGLVAAALLFLMLLAGLNYNNSLALMLCFMLCGVVLVSMHQCHRMLSGLKLQRAEAEASFAGQRGELLLYFDNTEVRPRSALKIRCAPCPAVQFELPPHQTCCVRASYQAGSRGRQRIDRLELSSSAPLGLFRAWSWLHLPLEALIYPAPIGSRPLPPPGAQPRGAQRAARARGEEEWAWLRPFQESDPPRSVAWKAYARGAPLLVAHYDAPAGAQRVLDLTLLPEVELEGALSQLARWVLDCERLGETYTLQLATQTLPGRHGAAQRRACLQALALYGL